MDDVDFLNKNLNWLEVKKPNRSVSDYNHIILETPIGLCKIEIQDWKVREDDILYRLSVTVNDKYIGDFINIDETKRYIRDHLIYKKNSLLKFLEENKKLFE